MKRLPAIAVFLLASFLLAALSLPGCNAADNLRMRDGVSFNHDLDQGFPIIADKMDDVQPAAGKATFLFFGAAGDLNTNRQAKRVVDLYKKYKSEQVKFVIIDVDHPANAQAKTLIKAYYQGYIPAEMLFDKQAKSKWTHTGEVDNNVVAGQIDKLL